MSQDPMVTFGSLLRSCISDEYLQKKARMAVEGALFILLGLMASMLTTYVLASLGLLV